MKITTCKSFSKFSEIASLRYDVYCKEQKKEHIKGIDHNSKKISDQFDFTNPIILYAEDNNELVGTLRYRSFKLNKFYKDKYKLRETSYNLKYSEIDLFIIRNDYRKSKVAFLLASEIFRLALRNETNVGLIEVELFLEKFYHRLGFKTIRKIKYNYGTRVQMFLNLSNHKHLIEVKSPFVKHIDNLNNEINQSCIHDKHILSH